MSSPLRDPPRPQAPANEDEVADLRRRLAESKEALRALSSGEVDTVAVRAGTSPVLIAAAQDALRQSHKQFLAVFDNATDAMMLFDNSGRCLQANPATSDLFDIAHENLPGMSIAHIAKRTALQSVSRRPVSGSRPFVDAIIRTRRGTRTAESRTLGDILPGVHLWILRDVTETRRTHEAQARLAAIVECSNDAILSMDGTGLIEHVNRAAEELYGYTAQELVGRSPAILEPPDRKGEFEAILSRAMAGERVRDLETCRQRKDGTRVDVSVTVSPIRDPFGTVVGASKITRDISERRRAESRGRDLLESAPDGMVVLDEEGRIIVVNRRAERIFGYERGEMIGRPIHDLLPRAIWRDYLDKLEPRRASPPTSMRAGRRDLKALRKDGERFDAEITLSPIHASDGSLNIIVAVRDVSERIKMQAQLALSDRMATIGSLAAGVAHEINNPLGAIIANMDLALEDIADLTRDGLELPGLEEEIRDARGAANRLRDIVRDLTIFSRHENEETHQVDITRVLESTVRMAWNEIRHRARLVKDYAVTPPVLASESRLGQVFLNLLINAAQAIPEGRANENHVSISSYVDDGYVVVSIEDTGAGMPPEVLDRLFTPFFTTKPVGQGTGLGLSICHRLVTGFGGKITVESQVGKGSTFRVLLPVAKTESPVEFAATSVTPTSTRRGRVLVIDDDRGMCEAMNRALQSQHQVTTVNGAEEALSRIRSGDRFDVILCDLMMPQITGMDFHERLEAELPEQAKRVIFFTGGAFTPRARAFLEETTNLQLKKPVDIRYLRKVINQRVG